MKKEIKTEIEKTTHTQWQKLQEANIDNVEKFTL